MCIRDRLIASIAKEEMGIADLLAAEAQRLMRGSQAAAAGEMMAVGQSVRQTLEAIIDLEHVLLEKLELTLGECMPVSYTHLDVYKRQPRAPCRISARSRACR